MGKTVMRMARPTMLKALSRTQGAERPAAPRLPGGGGDPEGGDDSGFGKRVGGGFGNGFGGSDGPDFGEESGAGGGMGGDGVAAILQEISQKLDTLTDLIKGQGTGPEGGKESPGIPGASDAMQGAQKIIDTLVEGGKAVIGAVDTTIQWARALGPLIEGVMAAGAPAGF